MQPHPNSLRYYHRLAFVWHVCYSYYSRASNVDIFCLLFVLCILAPVPTQTGP